MRQRPRHSSRAGRHQDHVIASLEAMLGQLRQWDDFRRFHRDMAQLLRDQEELTRNAAEVGPPYANQGTQGSLPAGIRRSESADRTAARAGAAIGSHRAGDGAGSGPVAAKRSDGCRNRVRRPGRGAAPRHRRRNAIRGQPAQDNRIGQLAQGHKQILQDLQEVLDVLANRRQQELARLVKKLRETEVDLATLRRQQEGLRKQIQHSARRHRRPNSKRSPAARSFCWQQARPLGPPARTPAGRPGGAAPPTRPPDKWTAPARRLREAIRPAPRNRPRPPKRAWKKPPGNSRPADSKPRPSWPWSNWPGWRTP